MRGRGVHFQIPHPPLASRLEVSHVKKGKYLKGSINDRVVLITFLLIYFDDAVFAVYGGLKDRVRRVQVDVRRGGPAGEEKPQP